MIMYLIKLERKVKTHSKNIKPNETVGFQRNQCL